MAAAESGCVPQSRKDMLRGVGNRLCGSEDTVLQCIGLYMPVCIYVLYIYKYI